MPLQIGDLPSKSLGGQMQPFSIQGLLRRQLIDHSMVQENFDFPPVHVSKQGDQSKPVEEKRHDPFEQRDRSLRHARKAQERSAPLSGTNRAIVSEPTS